MRALVPFVAGVAAGLVVLLATDGSDLAFIGACLVAVLVVGVAMEARRSR
jgi:hypothetical protein